MGYSLFFMQDDSFTLNIKGVENLVDSGMNKTSSAISTEEGVQSEKVDVLELPMGDEKLLSLRDQWELSNNGYLPKIKSRQDKNKIYYLGLQKSQSDTNNPVSSNLLFEAVETFIPQALAKNPEPVVFSDNTNEGKEASNDIKTMLQFHADTLCLRRTLGGMVRQWNIYFTGVVKHGWDSDIKDIKLDLRRPQNFVFDPDSFIDVYGNYVGSFLGERIELLAQQAIDMYPKHKDYITIKVDGKLGTKIRLTEWWTNEYSFTTFEDEVLDKHKNQYFNYPDTTTSSATPDLNHFAAPKMPYTFLSVFSLQEHPHDMTNLVEQNISNQDRISDRDDQISKNLRTSNNSLVLSKLHGWTSEIAAEGAQAIEDGKPILGPGEIDERSIRRLPASPLPSGVLEAQESDKNTLRGIFGTQGLTSQPQNEETTARGMILNQSHDSSRIGGGIGDALEQVADNIFNWWAQLYCVFYDEAHYGAIMGNGRAVELVKLINSDFERKFVISVSPNSMQPKDEITEQNLAIELANSGWLDPINLFKKLNYPDPMETAKMVTLYKVNPQLYMQQFFPENAPPQNPQGNPPNVGQQPNSPPQPLSQEPANAALSNVPLQ